jgi:polar amino acid transport system permease protein
MTFHWDWGFALAILPELARALVVTIAATAVGSGAATIIGLVLAVLRRSPWRPVRLVTRGVVAFVRNTPLLIQLYFLFYVMPQVGLRLSPFTAGVLALGVHYGAYLSEVYRAGIESVPHGQLDAARALGFGPVRTFWRVVLPQALPPIVPAMGNYVVAMFKDTPLLSTITVLEVLHAAKDIGSRTFRYVEPFTLVGVLFLILSLAAAAGVRRLERRLPAWSA